ncbi:hypothetical protein [Budvicia aquatica]|uniref:Uncharacterized protein n=1 Tax=Budvicia aquatica TaxID=82979 RepID=A0A484ZU18_9GAMM|nr:hypothetical protein [Budvicia aquatica]VFS51281.1 Uncharacterised protein [Budvicia aquatica]
MDEIHIPEDFTGRILVNVRNGNVICHHPLAENEYVLTVAAFMEIVKQCDKQSAEVSHA